MMKCNDDIIFIPSVQYYFPRAHCQQSHTYQRNVILGEVIGYAIKFGMMISVGMLCAQKVVEEAEI